MRPGPSSPASLSSSVTVHSMNTSMPSETARCWSVRIISRPVRSPTCASRAYLCPPKSRWEIRPSSVRSKSAPQSSSSWTRSGASWACSWAILQLLSIFPPRMVSRKWTSQLSSGQRLPMAAAMPPSAITVCALPSRDLQTIAVFAPASWAAMAARRPEPPAPITTTSYWCFSTAPFSAGAGTVVSVMSATSSEEPWVVEGTGGQQRDVEVHQRDREQRVPRVLGVPGVQLRHPGPQLVADRVLAEVAQPAAGDVPAGVARDRVEPDQHDVGDHEHGAEPHVYAAGLPLGRAEGQHRVVGEHQRDQHGGVPEPAVHVLQYQREPGLAGVLAVRLGHAAGRR